MPLIKQFLKSKPEVKVTFAVEKEAAAGAEQVMLIGEFTQWQPVELKRMKSGEFKATLNLPTDGPGTSNIATSSSHRQGKPSTRMTGQRMTMCQAPSGATTRWYGSSSNGNQRANRRIQKRLAIGEPFHYLSSYLPTYRHQFESN